MDVGHAKIPVFLISIKKIHKYVNAYFSRHEAGHKVRFYAMSKKYNDKTEKPPLTKRYT